MTIRRIRQITSLGLIAAIWIPLAVLAACAVQTPTTTPTQQSAVATVSGSEARLAAAGRAILACYMVPACSAVAPKPKIKAAYDSAYNAITAAQAVADAGGTPDLTATTAAMVTLQGLVAQLPKTGS
jgi:hypothetical protein